MTSGSRAILKLEIAAIAATDQGARLAELDLATGVCALKDLQQIGRNGLNRRQVTERDADDSLLVEFPVIFEGRERALRVGEGQRRTAIR